MNISKDVSSDDSSEPHVQTFDLWKNGTGNQIAKIDFQAAAKHNQPRPAEDLKSSCLNLIDQLSFYYDSFYDKLQTSDNDQQTDINQYKKL